MADDGCGIALLGHWGMEEGDGVVEVEDEQQMLVLPPLFRADAHIALTDEFSA